jgi:BNR/Asp-box repeat
MAHWLTGRRRISARLSFLVIALAAACTAALTAALASPSGSAPATNRQQIAQHLLKTKAGQLMTMPAQMFLHMQATGTRQLSTAPSAAGSPQPGAQVATGGTAALAPATGFTNVRVNNPALDTHQTDQTTQSETTIAQSGAHVAVGYNDSQQTLLFSTAGSNSTGYSYSTNGGRTFTDGGNLPNTPEFNNFGDPWMTSDRSGAMYYSTLAGDFFNFNLDVAVAKSRDGGKTWGTPVPVYRPPFEIAYSADKDALASGPDPTVKSRDNLYDTWDDFSTDINTGDTFTGLPVAHSTDGGKTWHLVYADRFKIPATGCSFQQYIGALPIVDKSTGVLDVVAEKIVVVDPNCTGTAPMQLSESFFKSADGGKTFSPGVKIADITAAEPDGLVHLGPGRYMRTIEFPTIAMRGNAIYVAWNDGGQGGHSHIRLATSTNGGATWSVKFVTSGTGDEVQPALSSDSTGIHLLYYQRNKDNTLDVLVRNSQNGTSFTARRVTTRSFRGTLTFPQFDPIIAFGYMGDYIANVSDGSHELFAWGDNRDTVRDFMYPKGRNDPDVFFAKQ